ncbi:MAG: RNA polymerase-binding protein RbpA [Acidothermus sp.]|nr:RNA polymerase-binding protein RbpA [Acidothermus sp.]
MVSGNSIRGSRVGAGPVGESERGEPAARRRVSFWCRNGHETRPSFAADVPPPEVWECPRCGLPAGPDRAAPPSPSQPQVYKSHLAYARERRSREESEAILAEALERLRSAPFYPRIF